MAVQQRRKSRSKRGMRRGHDSLSRPALSEEPTTGETHRAITSARMAINRGRKVIDDSDE